MRKYLAAFSVLMISCSATLYLKELSHFHSMNQTEQTCKNTHSEQDKINCAMIKYQINIPSDTAWPVASKSMADFALIESGLFGFKTVHISENLPEDELASTLFHEIEIHGKQHKTIATFFDSLFGTKLDSFLEQEAYQAELSNKEKFSSTPQTIASIEANLKMLYPEQTPSTLEKMILPFILAN